MIAGETVVRFVIDVSPALCDDARMNETTYLVGTDLVTIRVRAENTQGRYSVVELESAPGSNLPLHTHEFSEMYVVLSGEYEVQREFDRRGGLAVLKVREGESVTIPTGAMHSFRNASAETSRMLAVMSPGGFEPFFEEVGVPVGSIGGSPGPTRPEFMAALARYGLTVVQRPHGHD